MLSRRSVRIKVMQTLFALNCDQELTFENAKKSYWESVEKSYQLLLFNLYVLGEITKVAIEDGKKRKGKHLPSEIDKIFTPKLYSNDLMQSLASSNSLNKEYERLGFPGFVDSDLFPVRRLGLIFPFEVFYISDYRFHSEYLHLKDVNH